MIFLAVLLVIAIVVALFYRSKAKEFESLFELSKEYDLRKNYTAQFAEAWAQKDEWFVQPKLNKDGSIAKKRGRKPKAKK